MIKKSPIYFSQNFKRISGSNNYVNDMLIHSPNHNFKNRFSVRYIEEAIDNLNTGIGSDNIHTNHFKYASFSMLFIITRFINSCMIHNFVPSGMLAGVIRLIIKNNQGNVRYSENYREVMISSNFFNLLVLFSSFY